MESDRSIRNVLICVGASHRTAPVELLEAAMRRATGLPARAIHGGAARDDDATAGEEHNPATVGLAAAGFAAVAEMAVLSTCNRIEVYAVCAAGAEHSVCERIARTLDPSNDGIVFMHADRDALLHLCRVAAGLDSAVVGEPEIAGQVARAFQNVMHRNGGPPRLAAVARTARIAGRRARGETAISRGPASFSTVAVECARDHHGELIGRHAIVMGAGRMAALACTSLRAAGARISIVNRTATRAEQLAASLHAAAHPPDRLPGLIADADLVMAITASPVPVLDPAALRLRGDTAAELLIIDMAVPRNVAPDVHAMAGVRVIDMDELRRRAGLQLEERRREVPQVEAIIEEEIAAFESGDATLLPLIGDLHRHAERIRASELERALRGMETLDDAARQRIEHLSRALVNKLLHGPSARLRAADEGDADTYDRVIRELFALDGGE